MLKLLLITCVALLPLKVAAQEPSVVFHPDKDSADAAMALGDSEQLSALLDVASNPVRRELVAAYKARTDLRFEDSNKHADRCSRLALEDLRTYYDNNVRCRALRAGNALVDGDYSKWSTLLHAALDDADEHIRGMIHREAPGAYADNVKIFLPGTVSLPELAGSAPSFSRPAAGTYVKRVAAQQTEGLSPFIREPFFAEVEVNGQRALFAIDTGASATVIGGKTARALGLDQGGSEGRVNYDLVLLGERLSTTFANIETLRVGGFLASRATVLVSRDEKVLNVVGLDLIRQMGGLRFSSNRLTFADTSSCKGTLTLASDLVATQRAIVATVDVGGSPKPVDIDTGNRALLTVYGSDASPPGSQVKVNGVLGVATQSTWPHPLGAKYNLGTAILENFDMIVDLKKGKFCLESK